MNLKWWQTVLSGSIYILLKLAVYVLKLKERVYAQIQLWLVLIALTCFLFLDNAS